MLVFYKYLYFYKYFICFTYIYTYTQICIKHTDICMYKLTYMSVHLYANYLYHWPSFPLVCLVLPLVYYFLRNKHIKELIIRHVLLKNFQFKIWPLSQFAFEICIQNFFLYSFLSLVRCFSKIFPIIQLYNSSPIFSLTPFMI